ncbi:MAG: hypothetical protein J5982_04370 [Bacilli bacterium]|nr:hypothetical protein [Bacilli bacterium]
MKILILFLIGLFFYNKDLVSMSILESINIWYKNLFPSIFPVLILCDLIVSFNVFEFLIKSGGNIFQKLFKINKYGLLVFIVSLLCGTPSNMSLAYNLYKKNLLNEDDINKLIPLCLFFNPIFVINFTNIKVYAILFISTIITGLLFRGKNNNIIEIELNSNNEFDLNKSIEKGIHILLNILGTISIFMLLSNIIIIKKPIVSCILGGFFELTTGLYKTNIFFKGNNYLYLLILSFGGISIFTQIKGILKDIRINYYHIVIQRLVVFIISVLICILT